jgi:predicted permease
VDPGFDPQGVLTVELMAPRAKYACCRPVLDVMQRYTDALRAVPGVTAVGATSAPPLSAGTDQNGARFPGSPMNKPGQPDAILVDVAPVTPGYFRAMGIKLVEGEEFGAAQNDSANARVAIVDDVLAHRYFPNGGVVGRFMILGRDSMRVVGIARHVRMYNLQDPGREQMWVPHAFTTYRYMVLALRTSGDPLALAAAAQQAIHGVDAQQPIINIRRMSDAVRESLAERRLVLTLVSTFAIAAVLLAALGIYGVTSSAVNQRTRELGIRMALGANRGSIVWSVLSEPTRLVAFGLVIGLVGTFVAGRVVERLLYGIRPTDPITLVVVAFVLLGVAVVASYLPARRATRVDPVVALRAD